MVFSGQFDDYEPLHFNFKGDLFSSTFRFEDSQ